MRLVLFRHGIAVDRQDPECPPDTDRPLTTEGTHLTRQSAEGLRKMKLAPGAVLTSPLLRAMQTARIVAEVFEIKKSAIVTTDALLPLKDPGMFLSALADVEDGDVVAVGHAPHLDETLARALGLSSGSVTSLKKAGAALLEFGESRRPPARLVWILPAGTLRRLSPKH